MTSSQNDEPDGSSTPSIESATMAPMAPAERDENDNDHDQSSVTHRDPQQQQQDGDGDSNHNDSRNGSKAPALSETELMYSIESFGAIVAPVSITMILSALAVILINNEETIAAGEEAYGTTYEVVNVDESNTNAQNLGASVANTAIIVGVICAMTFVVVLLYKYRCLKIFYGYMIIVTALLLGYFTSNMFLVAIEIYNWRVTKLSFALIMYNYAVVGTLAIFYSRGIPRWITQGYLITSSVCLAWQLSYFNEWMAWSLLVMLALYDLFAVLSPCGPLKALAKLISKPGAPALPGLLYEAPLPEGVSKPKKQQSTDDNGGGEEATSRGDDATDGHETQTENDHSSNTDDNSVPRQAQRPIPRFEEDPQTTLGNGLGSSRRIESLRTTEKSSAVQRDAPQPPVPTSISRSAVTVNDDYEDVEVPINSAALPPLTIESCDIPQRQSASAPRPRNVDMSGAIQRFGSAGNRFGRNRLEGKNDDDDELVSVPPGVDASNTGRVPLALAKMYKCAIIDDKGVLRKGRFASDWQRYYSSDELRSRQDKFTARQLRSDVTAIFPPRGGKMLKSEEQKYDDGVAYTVYDRMGVPLRKFVVTTAGNVMQVLKKEKSKDGNGDNDEEKEGGHSIKLGLGDFVFYSLLVAKAAQYSYTAFLVCFLVVLVGLAVTLVILAIKGKALPALPISILLGVIGFLWTRQFLQPWVREVLMIPYYV